MSDMKSCCQCREAKPRCEFHANARAKDGLRAACKACLRLSFAGYRERNREEIRARDRRLRQADPARRARLNRSSAEWKLRNPEKFRAQQMLNRAVRLGQIKRGGCERAAQGDCGGPIHAHHEDYARPLEVVWLCSSHHGQRHSELAKEAI